MGQTWDIFNIDRREQDLGGGAKLGEFFWDSLPFLYQSLQIPRLPKAVDKWLSRGTVVVQPGPMGKLSTELLDMLFEALLDDPDQDPTDNFLDCIIFVVCCKQLLSVGKRHILRGLIWRHARVADCRLVCLGEYAGGDDQAPPGMLTDEEIKEIATTPGPYEHAYKTVEEAVAARCLYDFASESYESRSAVDQKLSGPLQGLFKYFWYTPKEERPKTVYLSYTPLDVKMITALSAMDLYYRELEYAEGPNVLCNMSKGEFVREDKLVVWKTKWTGVTLVHALLSRICYSCDDSISMYCDKEYRDTLVKGPWAGDRFRITSADEMPPLKGGKTWKDVTKDVNTLLCHLLELEMPEDDDQDGGKLPGGENE